MGLIESISNKGNVRGITLNNQLIDLFDFIDTAKSREEASNSINKYLHDIDESVEDKVNKLIKLLAEKENINEEMKCNQQLLWIKNMNNMKNRAEEIILKEYIYV